MNSRVAAVLTCLLAALALGACGGDDDDGGGGGGGDEAEIRALVAQLAGNDPAVCDRITDNFYEATGSKKSDCEAASKEPDEGTKPVVDDVKVDGATATVVVLDEDRTVVEVVDEGGEWKIDRIVSSEPNKE